MSLLGGLIVVYVALGMLAVGIALTVRMLRVHTPLRSRGSVDARVLADVPLGGAYAGVLTYLYVQALPKSNAATDRYHPGP